MKSTIISSLLLASIAFVVNAELTINSLLKAVSANTDQVITWDYTPMPVLTTVKVDIMNDDQFDLKLYRTVATNVDVTAKTMTWKVPADMENRNDYALRFTAEGPAGPVVRYSARFAVTGGTGKVTTPAPVVPTVPVVEKKVTTNEPELKVNQGDEYSVASDASKIAVIGFGAVFAVLALF